jgi:putative mycofactocin binding protein MftB
MKPKKDLKYVLASGTQVREEDFGLLFYTMRGPRLYFLSSDQMLNSSFFQGELTLDECAQLKGEDHQSEERTEGIRNVLEQLRGKGVILEC